MRHPGLKEVVVAPLVSLTFFIFIFALIFNLAFGLLFLLHPLFEIGG